MVDHWNDNKKKQYYCNTFADVSSGFPVTAVYRYSYSYAKVWIWHMSMLTMITINISHAIQGNFNRWFNYFRKNNTQSDCNVFLSITIFTRAFRRLFFPCWNPQDIQLRYFVFEWRDFHAGIKWHDCAI